jgi:hypothetical protein
MMTQTDIDHAVAYATGEELSEIKRRGFSIADPTEVDFDPEPDNLSGQVVDWDDDRFSCPYPTVIHLDAFLHRRSA